MLTIILTAGSVTQWHSQMMVALPQTSTAFKNVTSAQHLYICPTYYKKKKQKKCPCVLTVFVWFVDLKHFLVFAYLVLVMFFGASVVWLQYTFFVICSRQGLVWLCSCFAYHDPSLLFLWKVSLVISKVVLASLRLTQFINYYSFLSHAFSRFVVSVDEVWLLCYQGM